MLEGETSSVRSTKRDLMCSSLVWLINSVSVSLVVERCMRGGTGIEAEEGRAVTDGADVSEISMDGYSECG
jgi:hypothetical protein